MINWTPTGVLTVNRPDPSESLPAVISIQWASSFGGQVNKIDGLHNFGEISIPFDHLLFPLANIGGSMWRIPIS